VLKSFIDRIRAASRASLAEQNALNGRVIIEQAKAWWPNTSRGMDTAFDRLRRYARHHNQRLAEVARDCVNVRLDLDVLTSSTAWSVRRSS
jgi:AmiR/NasT family two-component response regulator